ncbi:MAG: metal-dependent hydrolase [Candidatus Bathyarchaeota archaeon]|nr:metal-dependent hydrolase [Candidatus Bathyarchaeota archaeon]
MFAIGHFAIGYLVGKASGNLLKVKLHLPLMFALSVLPDLDLLLQQFDDVLFMHRGPTHSIILLTVLMLPFLIKYRKQALPYYIVLLSHPLLGDYFAGGIELFWPLTQTWFGNFSIEIGTTVNAAVELALFAVATSLMVQAGDLQRLLKTDKYYLALLVALGAVAGPIISGLFRFESALPLALIPPSLFWAVLLSYSLFINLKSKQATSKHNSEFKHPG